jgi:hypothetical protein
MLVNFVKYDGLQVKNTPKIESPLESQFSLHITDLSYFISFHLGGEIAVVTNIPGLCRCDIVSGFYGE